MKVETFYLVHTVVEKSTMHKRDFLKMNMKYLRFRYGIIQLSPHSSSPPISPPPFYLSLLPYAPPLSPSPLSLLISSYCDMKMIYMPILVLINK